MHLDAGGAEGEQALWIFAEVDDGLFGMEGAGFGLV